MLKLAIANDSEIAIEALRRAISTVPDYQVLWIARTGAEAVWLSATQHPDAILMDMNMPALDGVEATRQIMQQSPCAILIVTASITQNTSKVFEAMGHGALDVVKTPQTGNSQVLLGKIAKLARLIQPKPAYHLTPNFPRFVPIKPAPLPPLIAIGASTGGPNALYQILSQFPEDFQAAIVIVQHIDEQFAPSLASWLSKASRLPVAIAQNGDSPKAGQVLIAGTNNHLILRPNCTLRYTREPSEIPYRPSVDIFFQSVAQHWSQAGIAILLTGMGRDGAAGMVRLRSVGWHTIAESAESCVVFGMPKAAIEQGGASDIYPLHQIPSRIMAIASSRSSAGNRPEV